ncbi:helix-turn-helix domain-containing protein [Frigoribacterium sp. PvP032]|uniref:helix-turn-helix domain-containing protein n=1 Tax=Frigoribacterium sp. PvP032 TaxID=2806589 RepID=UPI001AEA6081
MPVRLSDSQVVALRQRYRNGTTQVELAAQFGVSQSTVSSLVVGRARVDAGGPITHRSPQKLTDDDITDLRRRAAEGTSVGALATRFGVTPPTVTRLIRVSGSHLDSGQAV